MMRSMVAAMAMLVAMGTPAATKVQIAQGESVLTMRVDGELAIDKDGRVMEYRIRTKLAPQIEKLVAKAVPGWRFEPIQVDGQAVAAKTPMRITLAATEIKGGYEVRVDNVTFQPNTDEEFKAAAAATDTPVKIASKKLKPPMYPAGLQRAGVDGLVLLNLRLNPDGTVADVLAVQSSLLNVKGKSELLDRARGVFEKSALAAAEHWTFDVNVQEGTTPSAADFSVSVPVDYRISHGGKPSPLDGQWRIEFRGPRLAAPWLLDVKDVQDIGVSDLESGELMAASTRFKLSDRSVIGASL